MNNKQVLQNLSLSSQNILHTNIQYIPSVPVRRGSGPGIERIKQPTKPALIQGQMSSNKLMVIREMKSIFNVNIDKNSGFNIKPSMKNKAIIKPTTITITIETIE